MCDLSVYFVVFSFKNVFLDQARRDPEKDSRRLRVGQRRSQRHLQVETSAAGKRVSPLYYKHLNFKPRIRQNLT